MRAARRVLLTLFLCVLALGSLPARADTAAEIRRDARAALERLYATEPAAKKVGEKATAVLVFPKILKAGFIAGAQMGQGALFKGGKTVAYYRSVAGSYGLQAGIQEFSFALFFMTEGALAYLDKSEGFELGVGPSIVVLDEGAAKSLTTTTLRDDVYAFIYGQRGLMAGIGIQGSKITRIHPK